MKPKTKNGNGQRVNLGRGVATLPNAALLTPEQLQRARAKHALAHNEAAAKVVADLRAENARLKIKNDESDLEWIAMTRAKMADLDKAKTGQLVRTVLTGSRAARKLGQPFKVYDAISSFLAEHQTLTPAKPNPDGTTPEPTRLAKPGGAKTFAEIVQEREAYTKRLRELGLDAPFLPVGRG